MKPALHVVAGVLVGPQGHVLIAQRPAGTHLAGGWEFPGGKLKAGEERAAGLARELREELGVHIQRCRSLIRLHHSYPDRDIDLDVWRVEAFTGEPQGLDGQALRWCPVGELPRARLLPADAPVITALRLPERITAWHGPDHDLLAFDEFSGGQVRAGAPVLARGDGQPVLGVACTSLAQALTAAQAGAGFIVFTQPQSAAELAMACRQLNLPVFASGVELSSAWDAGAVGIARL